MKKRVICLLAAALLLLCLWAPAAADFDPNTRNSVAVVYTCLDLDGGEYGFGWGSGFFVGNPGENPSCLITNYHVIEDFIEYDQGERTAVNVDGQRMTGRAKIRVYYSSDDYEEAYVVGYNAIKDVAVLKLAGPTAKRTALPLEVPTEAMVGSTVYAVGYPGLADNVFASATTKWGNSDSTVTRGTVSRLFLTAGTGTESVQIDCDIKNGNSGGPLISDNGTVIGINTYSVGNSDSTDSINYAINISEAITLLNQYSVPYVTGKSGGSVGAAVTTGNSEGDGVPAAAIQPQQPVQPSGSPGGFPLWAIIVIAVVVVAGIAVAVILATRGKKAPAAPAAPAQPVQQPVQQPRPAPARPAAPARRGSVRSLSPQHRGNPVGLGPQPVFLGRNPDCAVIYQSNTPGVSGRHCSLAWDPASGEFILTDLQSTYGTYLQNGQKLTPNMAYRLRSGDQFYLGERANLLQVSVE